MKQQSLLQFFKSQPRPQKKEESNRQPALTQISESPTKTAQEPRPRVLVKRALPANPISESGKKIDQDGHKRLKHSETVPVLSEDPKPPMLARAVTVPVGGKFARTQSLSSTASRQVLTVMSGRARIVVGDITKVYRDHSGQTGVVNAANKVMLGGGGVDGAIHRAAGPRLYAACLKLPAVRPGCRCLTGEVKVTPAFDLPATYIIHTVGPVFRGDGSEAALLASCYRKSLNAASDLKLDSVAFPAISTGVYGYPLEDACEIALAETRKWSAGHDYPTEVVFCCFDQKTADVLVDLA